MFLFRKAPPKSVLVTGCSEGGIGHALAAAYAAAGCRVYATARRARKMESLKEFSNIKLIELDVTNGRSVANAAKQVGSAGAKEAGTAARRAPRRPRPLPPVPTRPAAAPHPRNRQVLALEPNGPDIIVNNAGAGMRGSLLVRGHGGNAAASHQQSLRRPYAKRSPPNPELTPKPGPARQRAPGTL
jgi:NAD(P)-dependent dehydrogenase (short-subunit alcohol dehydrogenase family)